MITRTIAIRATIPTARYQRGLRLACPISGVSLRASIEGISLRGSSAYSDHCLKSFLVFFSELKASLATLIIGCATCSKKALPTLWPENLFSLTFSCLPQWGQKLVWANCSRPQWEQKANLPFSWPFGFKFWPQYGQKVKLAEKRDSSMLRVQLGHCTFL